MAIYNLIPITSMISLATTVPFTLPYTPWHLCYSWNVPAIHLLQSLSLAIPSVSLSPKLSTPSFFTFSGHCLKIIFLVSLPSAPRTSPPFKNVSIHSGSWHYLFLFSCFIFFHSTYHHLIY